MQVEGEPTMTVIDDQVWLLHKIMANPESSNSILVNLFYVDRRRRVSVAEHSKAEERVSHLFREEDTSDLGWHVGKCISHAANDDVLKDGGTLDKR
jgi:hypothetical protein